MKKFLTYLRKLFTDNKHWLLVAVSCYLVGCVIGVIVFEAKPDLVMGFLQMLKEKLLPNRPVGFSGAMWIFMHNFWSSAVSMLLGIVFGLAPLIDLVLNGFAMGCVVAVALASTKHSIGFSIAASLAALIPHGIIELPTTLLAAALGLKIGWSWIKPAAPGGPPQGIKNNFMTGLYALPGIALLLFIAAFIEVFITPQMMQLVSGPQPFHLVP